MPSSKIFNDPVYGFVSVPYGILFDLIEHPYFQRLRHIKQLGLTHYVYPGALHTRFHHALGALHLMQQSIEVLRSKGIQITNAEAEAVCIAILLHDIGHGPFSHTLEHCLININHETLSILYMEEFNRIFEGKLDIAIQIFKNEYPKQFLHQLVSSQLDMDRMDYLNRDSFFTGVSEGVIGYDRIIKMLTVKNDQIVVEEKGIYSIEKFLIARRLMYWQVYLHKTVLGAEQMLIQIFKRAKYLAKNGTKFDLPERINYFLYNNITTKDLNVHKNRLIEHFSSLDDGDIFFSLKKFLFCNDKILSLLSKCIVERKLFKVELNNLPFNSDYVKAIRHKIANKYLNQNDAQWLLIEGKETNIAYSKQKNEISILLKKGTVRPLSAISDHTIESQIITKYYLCYPKNIL